MKLKFTSRFLVSSILFSNLNLLSFASTFTEDGRYEIFNGNHVSITDNLEEDTVDIEVEGKSLVNLLDVSKLPIKVNSYSSVEDRYAFLTDLPCRFPLKADTQYTLFVKYDVESYQALSSDYNRTSILPKLSYVDGTEAYPLIESINTPGEYYNVHIIRPAKDVSQFYVGWAVRNATVSGVFHNAILLEGNYLNEDISFFEGVKSLGEDTPIEVKSSNKNLFDLKIFEDVKISNGTSEITQNGIKITTTGSTSDFVDGFMGTGISVSPSIIRKDKLDKYFIKVKELTDYTLSYKTLAETVNHHDVFIEFRDASYKSLGYHSMTNHNTEGVFTLTSPKDTKYIHFRFDNNLGGNSLLFYDIQLEENSVATEYEEYQSDTLSVQLDTPLRSTNREAKDKIVKKNEHWYIERNCGQQIFDGSENWALEPNNENQSQNIYRMHLYFPDLNSERADILSDKFLFKTNYNVTEKTEEGIFGSLNGSTIYIDILKEKVDNLEGTNTDEKFKKWLSINPVTAVYELREPYIEKLDANLSLPLYLETTHITSKSSAPANMKIVVDRVANRAKESVELAEASPTIESLSNARYWTNLMRESTLKDSLQNKTSSITNVEGLDIEKKSATMNADIYIKPKNTLSLSLDTNSIVFDEVDATENVEMQNAVNLTISSSLPYQVNAYLESEIYNSDKTEMLDKSVLNIKANSSNEYKTFTDLSSPIMLLDDQDAGMNNMHGIDLKLVFNAIHKADVYKTTVKFEAEQK